MRKWLIKERETRAVLIWINEFNENIEMTRRNFVVVAELYLARRRDENTTTTSNKTWRFVLWTAWPFFFISGKHMRRCVSGITCRPRFREPIAASLLVLLACPGHVLAAKPWASLHYAPWLAASFFIIRPWLLINTQHKQMYVYTSIYIYILYTLERCDSWFIAHNSSSFLMQKPTRDNVNFLIYSLLTFD